VNCHGIAAGAITDPGEQGHADSRLLANRCWNIFELCVVGRK